MRVHTKYVQHKTCSMKEETSKSTQHAQFWGNALNLKAIIFGHTKELKRIQANFFFVRPRYVDAALFNKKQTNITLEAQQQ